MNFLLAAIKPCSKYLLLITLFVAITSHATNSDDLLIQLQNKAKQQQLWKKPEWLNLLHFEGDSNSPDDYVSQVADENFYITENGTVNPETELLATLAGFYDSGTRDDLNAQCKFIARLDWLKQKLAIDPETLPAVNCKKYIEWRSNVNPQQVCGLARRRHIPHPLPEQPRLFFRYPA